MKRRDFMKTAGVAVAAVGTAGTVLAKVAPDDHLPWEEIERVIRDYGFEIYDLDHVESIPPGKDATALKSWGKPGDLKVFYRMLHSDGHQHHIGFERLENKEGKGKLTFVYLSFQEHHVMYPENDKERIGWGSWTEHPIKRFYMDPQNWEAELREAISSGFSKTFNS
jgi:hypothetical protein